MKIYESRLLTPADFLELVKRLERYPKKIMTGKDLDNAVGFVPLPEPLPPPEPPPSVFPRRAMRNDWGGFR